MSAEYADAGGAVSGEVGLVCAGFVGFTGAGVVAVLAQAAAYLTAGKIAAVSATGATPEVHVDATRVRYSCLPADAATQIAALQALIVQANVVQTVQTIR